MKNFLLSAVCALGLGFMANAETISLNVNDATNIKGEAVETKYKDDGTVQEYAKWQPLESLTIGDYNFTFTSPETGTASAYYTAKEGGQFSIRLYKDCSMTISAPAGTTMGNILINGSNGSDGCLESATPGTATYSSNKINWGSTNGESSVTFNFAKSYRVQSLEITTGAGTPVEPDPVDPDPSAVTVKSVKEIIALESKTPIVTDFALTVGYVNKNNIFVCDAAGDFIQIYNSNTLSIGDVIPAGLTATYELYNSTTPELSGATIPTATAGTFTPAVVAPANITTALVNSVVMIKNVILAEASPAAKANFTGTADGVELSFRNNYSLESVPAGTYDITVVVTIYQDAPSLYVTNYTNDNGETPGPVEPDPTPTETVAKSVKEILALESKTPIVTDFALTVGFVNKNNIFVCDAAGDFIQIYNSNTLSIGDVIPAGLKATYELYNGTTPELTSVTAFPEATAGTFTPAEVAPADITNDLVNSVVLIKNVILAEASPAEKANFTGTSDGVELSLRNNYSLESVPAGTYDITVVVTIYNGAPSLYVTNFTESAGIAGVEADNNAPVEFFNLQGVRVANPENGLYIRRQGSQVTKVYVK